MHVVWITVGRLPWNNSGRKKIETHSWKNYCSQNQSPKNTGIAARWIITPTSAISPMNQVTNDFGSMSGSSTKFRRDITVVDLISIWVTSRVPSPMKANYSGRSWLDFDSFFGPNSGRNLSTNYMIITYFFSSSRRISKISWEFAQLSRTVLNRIPAIEWNS